MKKKRTWALGLMLKKISLSIRAKVILEPEWKVVGRIIFKNGKHSYFRYNTLDINPMGASEIARDKDYANFFIKKLGFPIVPKSKTFFSDKWSKAIGALDRNIDNAYLYSKKIGFPVVVKPNSGSQGFGVSFVHNKAEFYKAMNKIFKSDKVALVQKPVAGRDYRIVVLDNSIISAYERIPLSVIGNGKSTIKELLDKKQEQFSIDKRDTKIKTSDPRIALKLKHQNLNFDSVPKKDERIFLLDNANLSTGGDSVDVTKYVHKDFQKIAILITQKMGLRLCGVDLIIDGEIKEKPKKYWILEINSAPGLDHYVKSGKKQEKIVENLYIRVLRKIETGSND